MNYRETHKTELKTILESITFELANLSVSDHYITNADKYPYIFITSNRLLPNSTNNSLYDTGTYYRSFEYDINCVFDIYETNGVTEARIDELECLILDKLSSREARDNANWNDLVILEITSPYNVDPQLVDNTVIKTFRISIKTLQPFV